MKTLLKILLFILFMAALGSCASSNPYWVVYHHDGVENRQYMKRGWPYNDATCSTYDGNRPVQHSTWAKQYYWRFRK